jgi:hypothetical protein
MTWPSPWSNQIINTLIVGGNAGGLFVYSGTPGLGNPPIFYASSQTTDPYGNSITPTVGLTGAGQFNAGNTIINDNGIFTYSSTPALGNLIGSTVGAAANTFVLDPFGNQAFAGTTSYENISGSFFAINTIGVSLQYATAPAAGGPWTSTTSINFNSLGRASITDASNLVRNITRSTSQSTGQTAGNTTVPQALYAGVFHTSTDLGNGDLITISSEFNAQMGQTTAETFTIGYQLDGGTVVNLATIGAAIVAAAAKYSGTLQLNVRVITNGASGTANFWLSGGVQAAANVLFTNGAAIAGTVLLPSVAFNTTIVHTLQLVGTWGGAGGSDQSFETLGATYVEY